MRRTPSRRAYRGAYPSLVPITHLRTHSPLDEQYTSRCEQLFDEGPATGRGVIGLSEHVHEGGWETGSCVHADMDFGMGRHG